MAKRSGGDFDEADCGQTLLSFTSFMLDPPVVGTHEEIGADLVFLDEGTRGFMYGVDESAKPIRIRVGNEVFLA